MREIKFRAWDRINKRMVESKDIVRFFYDGEKLGASDGHIVHSEIMQFTGLHDKTGKDIYEGDIIEEKVPESLQREVRPIRKSIMRFVCKFDVCGTGNCHGFVFDSITVEGGESKFINHIQKDCKIVGNIYQNPELLKREKK